MKKLTLKPVALAAGLLLAAPAFAAGIDFSGSNIYMKFLDGDQRVDQQTWPAATPPAAPTRASGPNSSCA